MLLLHGLNRQFQKRLYYSCRQENELQVVQKYFHPPFLPKYDLFHQFQDELAVDHQLQASVVCHKGDHPRKSLYLYLANQYLQIHLSYT